MMRFKITTSCLAAALIGTLSVSALAAPIHSTLGNTNRIGSTSEQVVPAKTPVLLSLNDGLSGGAKKEGEEVTYTVLSDVMGSDGTVLIAAGSTATGKVVSSHKSGMWSVNAKLALSCDYATAVDGNKIPFDHPVWFDAGGGASDWHFLIFGLIGLCVWPGDDVSVGQGKPFVLNVASDSKVTGAMASSHVTLQIVHGKDNWQGTVKSIAGSKVTFTLPSGDMVLKVSDLNKVSVAK